MMSAGAASSGRLWPTAAPCSLRGPQSEQWVPAGVRPHRCQVGLVNTAAPLLAYKWCLVRNVEAWKKENERWNNPSAHIPHAAALVKWGWNLQRWWTCPEKDRKRKKKKKELDPANSPITVQSANQLLCHTLGPWMVLFFFSHNKLAALGWQPSSRPPTVDESSRQTAWHLDYASSKALTILKKKKKMDFEK